MPRHPPCALTHLTTNKMLASTMQHSTHNHTPAPTTATTTTPPTQGNQDALGQPDQERTREQHPHRCLLRTQQCAKPPATEDRTMFEPSSRSVPPSHTHTPPPQTCSTRLIRRGISERRDTHPSARSHEPTSPSTVRLLRKEVIQPHLPVRLPCYDFVPIASPTFDDSPQASWVRPSASGVTNFRDVTGGVYKARERIHRSVADLRLLATPTSRGRVADPDPN